MENTKQCRFDSCALTDLQGRGWCKAHYQRWRRYGDPALVGSRPSLEERLALTVRENETGMRICKTCGEEKPLDVFYSHRTYRNGRVPNCDPCRSSLTRQNAQARRERDLAGVQRKGRAFHLRTKYGISIDEYEARVATQGGRCAVCGDLTEKLLVDHDHVTGAVRDLLCNPCNLALGFVSDSTERLLQLAEYVRKHAA